MAKLKVDAGGGFPAIFYTLKKGIEAGGLFKFFVRMASKNACKTCALGMGGQKGGMVNELGQWPEFCKKSVQAQAGDMAGVITEAFLSETPIAHLANMSPRELENLGRITFPIIAEAGDTHFKKTSWDDAMTRMATGFKNTTPDRVFFYASGRASNEAAFLLQLVGRAYGTNNINNCSYYCHQASGVALKQVYGSGTASVALEDLEKSDLAIVVGANPASNHPRLITQLVELRKRGGKVIVINPLKELGLQRFRIPSRPGSLLFGSDVSDLYIQPKVGADIYLFKAILKGLIEKNHIDEMFIDLYTAGWADVRKDTEQALWDDLCNACGVEKAQVDEIVEIIIQAQCGIFMWAMGLTHHMHGVDNILALCNIALSQGWLGKPGCGLLPIRGHSNVQGVGTVGVAPAIQQAFAQKMEVLFKIHMPQALGLDTFASMKAAEKGQIDVAFLLGGNLYGSNPDADWAKQALSNIPLLVTASTKLNTGHPNTLGKQATLILPVLARDEESQATTQESMFNYVRLSEGGKPAVKGEMRSEVQIIADLAEKILPKNGFDWASLRSHQTLRDCMAETIEIMAPVKNIGKTRQEFQLPGRTFHKPQFSTSDRKAQFQVVATPVLDQSYGEFQLMTLRSEGQFNTVVYEEEDLYRGNTRRDIVMVSNEDALRLGLAEGHRVRVETASGKLDVLVSISEISAGSLAMYYPEANVLVPQVIDPKSKTPAFKSVSARLIKH